jgi:iron complex transport system substrate-binding protein
MDCRVKPGNDVTGNGCRDMAPQIRHIVSMRQFPPRRIVCLTEETVETLYLLGEQDRIVGVSGYAVRPPRVRREKPRVAAFISADIPKILALKPDLCWPFPICKRPSSPIWCARALPSTSSTSARLPASSP